MKYLLFAVIACWIVSGWQDATAADGGANADSSNRTVCVEEAGTRVIRNGPPGKSLGTTREMRREGRLVARRADGSCPENASPHRRVGNPGLAAQQRHSDSRENHRNRDS